MPIDISEFAEPRWIRLRTRYTIAGLTSAKERFMKFEQYPRSYRNGVFPQAGYNPNHNSTRVEKIRLDSDDYTLKGR